MSKLRLLDDRIDTKVRISSQSSVVQEATIVQASSAF